MTSSPRESRGTPRSTSELVSGRKDDLLRDGSRFIAMPMQRAPRADTAKSGRKDVLGCVDVRIRRVSTAETKESGLPFSRRRACVTTLSAAHRGVGRFDLNESPTASLEFVLQLLRKLVPALRKDRSVERRLGAYMLALPLHRASRGPGHIRDGQSFDCDGAVADRDVMREPVKEVVTDPGFSRPQLCDLIEGCLVASGSLTPPDRPPLAGGLLSSGAACQAPQTCGLTRSEGGTRSKLASREGNGCDHSHVYSHGRTLMRQRLSGVALATKRDVPTERVPEHRHMFDRALGFARPTKSHPAKLGNTYLAPRPADPSDADRSLSEPVVNPKALATPLAAEPRIPSPPSKERLESAIEVMKCLLENVGMRLRKPWDFVLGFGQVRRLRVVPKTRPIHPPRGLPLLEGGVPEHSATSCPTVESRFLGCRRIQAIAMARVFEHEHTFAPTSDGMRPCRIGVCG